MFYDANIGPTGYIVRIQLRLRSFGIPNVFLFPSPQEVAGSEERFAQRF